VSPRTLGAVIAAAGGIVLALSVLADPLGIGGTDEFGWKQILGAVVGAAGLLVGLVLVYLPRRGEVEPGAEQ
jgi:predicted MFS family arabinose efflux permease